MMKKIIGVCLFLISFFATSALAWEINQQVWFVSDYNSDCQCRSGSYHVTKGKIVKLENVSRPF